MEDTLLEEAFTLADPKHKTKFQKSRTAFLSFSPWNGQINFSAFLARTLGMMSGDRLGFIKHKNPLIWLVFKTNQSYRTLEVRIRAGSYTMNSKEMSNEIAKSFNFNPEYTGKIRLYVNYQNPIKHKIQHPDGSVEENQMMQLFDVPNLRNDFASPEIKKEYCTMMASVNYIIKPKE